MYNYRKKYKGSLFNSKREESLVLRIGRPMFLFFPLRPHNNTKKECVIYKVNCHLKLRIDFHETCLKGHRYSLTGYIS